MPELQFALFETAIGACGIVWTARGVAGVQIHDGSARATRSRLLRRFAGAQDATPPETVQRAIDGIVELLRGEKRDLNDVTLDVDLAERLAANLLALDLQTVVAKSKLLRALRETERG